MERTKLLAITTVLIAVIAVIGVASMASAYGPASKDKRVYVSGGDKYLYRIHPETKTVTDSKYVGQASTWPSNQYPGDKYIWMPGFGAQGLTVINSKSMRVECATGYGSNWVEVQPAGQQDLAAVTTLGTDTVTVFDADMRKNNPTRCTRIGPTYVYDLTKHDGPCDMTLTTDGQVAWIPDLMSGITLGPGKDSVTGVNIQTTAVSILYMPRCNNAIPLMSFMTTVDPYGNYPYVFVESFESLLGGNSGSESVIDISNFNNPKEIVRFVQNAVISSIGTPGSKCPNALTDAQGPYLLALNGVDKVRLRGGLGLNPYSDEFTPDGKYNLLNQHKSGDVAVVDLATLTIVNTISPGIAGAQVDTGDFDRYGTYWFNTNNANAACYVAAGNMLNAVADGCVNVGVRTRGIVAK